MSQKADLAGSIKKLKEAKGAVILAHNYQLPEVQKVADFTGDSLELSRKAARADGEVIVFCGVHFMAEVAAILSPEKTVILPEAQAGCPLADSITAQALRDLKKDHPEAPVVSYVNSSAAVKAESDICVTSSNAVNVVNSLPEEKFIFVPDQNLGKFVADQTGKEVINCQGYCPSHHVATVEDVKAARENYPQAPIVVHPECKPEVTWAADQVLSTGKMLKYAQTSEHTQIVVGTETGILYRLQQENPEKEFYPLSQEMVCPDMKLIDLEKLNQALKNLEPRITVPEEIAEPARGALERMLSIV